MDEDGSSLAIGSCLNVENFTIDGKAAGWDQATAVDIGDEYKAWLTKGENNSITLTWKQLA